MTELTILTTKIRRFDELYSLNDLHKSAGGEAKHEPNQFMRNANTQELIEEISKSADLRNYKAVKVTRGKFGGTYVCRELVYAYAMWISAKFHLQVIRAFDALHNQPSKLSQEEELVKLIRKQIQKTLPKSLPVPVQDYLLPPDQAKEITERLDSLGRMFHPFSDQFADVLGIMRALRGLHPKHGLEVAGYRKVMEHSTAARTLASG